MVHRVSNKHIEECSAPWITREMQIKTAVRQCFTLLRMALARRQKIVSIDKVVERLEPLSTAGGSVRWCSHCGKQYGRSLGLQGDQPVHPKGGQSRVLTGRTDAEAEGHLMRRADSFEKTLMLAKIEGRRRRGRQRVTWLDGIAVAMHMGLSGLQEMGMDREAWRAAVHRVTKSRTRLSVCTELETCKQPERPSGDEQTSTVCIHVTECSALSRRQLCPCCSACTLRTFVK